jgi:hypothetical protein
MADTLRLTQQCPSGGCYTITDRGTLQQLVGNGAITALPIVMEDQGSGARGGSTLMINQYRAYALNPAKVPAAKTEGALAFLDFVTSRDFQRRLRSFPSRSQPGFFPAAFPVVTLARPLRRTVSARRPLVLRGSIASAVPGAPPLEGAALRLTRFTSALTDRTLARARTGGGGSFRLRWRPDRSARLFLTAPRFRDLSPLRLSFGRVRVRAAVRLVVARSVGSGVVLRGRAWPATGRRRAWLVVHARPTGGGRFRAVRAVRLRGARKSFRVAAPLEPGSWRVRVRYVDRGVVEAGRSRTRSVTVG